MLDSTIVYCAGEFGRTPRVNGQAGRDHWARAMAVFLAGGGIRRGYVLGGTDANGMAPIGDPCTPADVAATVFHLLGVEPSQELQTPAGRPVTAFREGKVLEGLVETRHQPRRVLGAAENSRLFSAAPNSPSTVHFFDLRRTPISSPAAAVRTNAEGSGTTVTYV